MGRKQEVSEKKHLTTCKQNLACLTYDGPRLEPQLWQWWDYKRFRTLKISILNHEHRATATSTFKSGVLAYSNASKRYRRNGKQCRPWSNSEEAEHICPKTYAGWLVVLVFYSPSTHFRSFQARSVNLATLSWANLLGSVPVLSAHLFPSNWQIPFLNRRKGENSCRNIFMTKSQQKNVAGLGLEPATAQSDLLPNVLGGPALKLRITTVNLPEMFVDLDWSWSCTLGRWGSVLWVGTGPGSCTGSVR